MTPLAALALHAAALARAIPLDLDAVSGDTRFAELVARARSAPPAPGRTVGDCEARAGSPRCTHALPARCVERLAPPCCSPARPGYSALTCCGRGGARDDRRLIALVRAPDDAAARARLGGAVDAIRGDVARPDLGLDEATWRDVGTIVHAAATMRLADGWDAHAAVNVGGTAEVARAASERGLTLHYISTLSVFASTDRSEGRHAATDVPDAGALAYGGYAQTKLAAEAIVRATRGRAAPTTIFRLGLLVGAEQLRRAFAGLTRLGAVPAVDDALRVDQTPVALAAAAIATHATATHATTEHADAVHHIAGRSVSFAELVAPLALPVIDAARWAALARAQLADLDIAMAYLSLGRALGLGERARPFDLFLATGADFAAEVA